MCEGAKDSVQVVVLCCALFRSGSLQWGAYGLLIVIAGWSFWIVQFKFREGDKKEMQDGLFNFIAW